MYNIINSGTTASFNSISSFKKITGIAIVKNTNIKSVIIALFLSFGVFLFNNIAPKYWIKFMTFELKIL